MIISQKNYTIRPAGEKTISLTHLLDAIAKQGDKEFKYMGLEAESLAGPIGLIKGLLF